MPLKYNGKDLYPLEVKSVNKGGKTLYDRDTRGKSYFYLCVRSGVQNFFTKENEPVLTNDGQDFLVQAN